MNRLLCIVLALSVIGAAGAAANDFNYPDPERWAGDLKAFDQWDAKNAVPGNAVLFVGSSSIRLWKTAEFFPGLPVINRGFGGSWMADSVHFVDRLVLRYRPAVVIVYAGDNDIAGGLPPEAVNKDFIALADAIHKTLPATQIICLPAKPSPSRWNVWPQMKEANRLNREYAETVDSITYVDLAAVLLDSEGKPDPSLYESDRLHLNDKGYAKWTARLAPVLKEKYNPAD